MLHGKLKIGKLKAPGVWEEGGCGKKDSAWCPPLLPVSMASKGVQQVQKTFQVEGFSLRYLILAYWLFS